MTATVLSPGFLTTVQDEGRTGFRKIGVSSGGALDVHASRVANLLVGNEPAAAGLEVTLGGLRLRFNDARVVAWCGGAFEVQVRDFALPAGRAAVVQAGEEIWLDRPQVGCRAWLAISGGAAVPEVLGSRSTDLRARCGGFEGRALRAGDVLSLGRVSGRSQAILDSLAEKRIASWSAPAEWGMPAVRHPRLRVVQGSEWSDFDGAARTAFLNAPFVMTPQADRMGVRLSGSTLHHGGGELISEAVTPGTIQVPPSGEPIILLPDCQTIGGYPKLAHVITVDLPIAAQLRPGDDVRFEEVSLGDAHRLLLQRERDIAFFRTGLLLRTR